MTKKSKIDKADRAYVNKVKQYGQLVERNRKAQEKLAKKLTKALNDLLGLTLKFDKPN